MKINFKKTIIFLLGITLLFLLTMFLPSPKESTSTGSISETTMKQEHKPAHFEFGAITWVKTFEVSSQGGSFEVNVKDTPIDKVVIGVPPNAIEGDVSISVGFDNGKLVLNTGEASGVVITLKSDVQEFQKPLKISVWRDAYLLDRTPVGYAVEENGTLRPVDTRWDKAIGQLWFYTFRPTTSITWVYAR